MHALIERARKLMTAFRPLAYGVGLVLLVLLGLLFKDASFGKVVIIAYGFVALLAGVKSGETFKMAVIALVGTAFLSMVRNADLAGNFAQYAFLLLCFGVFSAFGEQWRESRVKKL